MSGKENRRFERGARVFRRLQRRLLPRHKGEIVAVEPGSGRYFIGKDELDAAHLALAAMPGKIFCFFRVGYPAVHKFRRRKPRG